ncbi:Zinc finger BED domain-containing protein DAYSLEEPER, partial [Striga hermonthica]
MEQDVDSPYLAYFNEPDEEFDDDGNAIVQKRDKKKIGPPRDSDWDACEQFISCLAVFYEVTLRVSASNHPTIHTTFHDIVHMEEALISRSICTPQTATQKLMADIASLMKTKYNKYFGQLKDLNPFIFVGIVMDPRLKMKHVTKLLSVELMWSDYEVEKKEKEIKALLFELFEEYSAKNDKSLKKRSVEPVTSSSNSSTLKRQKIKENDSHIESRVNLATSNL